VTKDKEEDVVDTCFIMVEHETTKQSRSRIPQSKQHTERLLSLQRYVKKEVRVG
jgi:hypothetical protein